MTGVAASALLALGVMGLLATAWAAFAEANGRSARRDAERYREAQAAANRTARAERERAKREARRADELEERVLRLTKMLSDAHVE